MTITGRARALGDDVNTDYIISSSRKRVTIDPKALAPYLLESIAREFAASVQAGDLIVAGKNFGCGSAMEVAVTVIQAAGIGAVLAPSFARSFFRNAINNGLPVVECDTSFVAEGDGLSIQIDAGVVVVRNTTSGVVVQAAPMSPIVMNLLEHGGLVPFLAAHPGWE